MRTRLLRLLTVAALTAAVASSCSTSEPRVSLFGDSLGYEASEVFSDWLDGEARIDLAAVPGAALCDLAELLARESDRRPDIAVIQYSGNSATECMRAPDGAYLSGQALVDKYAADAESVTATLRDRGAAVYLAGSPRTASNDTASQINDRYAQVAARWAEGGEPVFYIDAASPLLGPDGAFAERLPCLPVEGADRGCAPDATIQVRASDGVHFCPEDTGGLRLCPVWSSGAYRFGTSLAAPVIERLDPPDAV